MASPTVRDPVRCETLVAQGKSKLRQGAFNEALALFREAILADRLSSVPHAWLAQTYLEASTRTAPENASKYVQIAEQCARDALERKDDDMIALGVLGIMATGNRPRPPERSAEVDRLLREGSSYFQQRQPALARTCYEQAALLEPTCADAAKFLGDCYFVEHRYELAEPLFRRGVQLDPYDPQGWRFLADALLELGRRAEAYDALVSSVSAHPLYFPAWATLAMLLRDTEQPMRPMRVRQFAWIERDAAGKPTINLSSEASVSASTSAAWIVFASALSAPASAATAFQTERKAWESMLLFVRESRAKSGGDGALDPSLLAVLQAAEQGYLDAALFLLRYREEWREDFERYKRQYPSAVREFVYRFRYRPW